MSVTVTVLGLVRAGGGALILAQGSPSCGVEWEIDGPGAIVPLASRSNVAGTAAARYDATGVPAGATATITARFYA